MIRVTTIERYVLRSTAAALGAAFALLTAILLLINFVGQSRDVGTRVEASFADLMGLALLQTPTALVLLLPFVVLFGTLAAFVNLNRRSELIAMRAAGVSAWRFIFPAAAFAFVLGVLVLLVADPVVTDLERRYADARERVAAQTNEPRREPEQVGRVWARQGDRQMQLVIGGRPSADGTPRLTDVTVLFYTVDARGTPQFTRRIDAPRATLREGRWVMEQARDVTPGAAAAQPQTVSVVATEQAIAAFARQGAAERLSFWELPGAIDRAEAAGLSSVAYRIRLHELFATPILLAGMSVLAAAFSLRLLRLGDLSLLAGSGVALGFFFFFIGDLSAALGRAGYVTPFAAAWTPPLLALLTGFTLLCYTEDG